MLDLRNEFQEAVNNVVNWRTNPNYNYPHNIAVNMMYRAYSTRFVYESFIKGELPEYDDFQEASVYIRQFYSQVAAESVHPYLLGWIQGKTDEEVGTIIASRYIRMAQNAVHDAKAREELEFSYIFEMLNDMSVLYYIAFRLCGESQSNAIGKMTGIMIQEIQNMDYTTVKQVFQQLLVSRFMNQNYRPLP